MRSPVICGSRGSPLALHQTQQVLERLQSRYPGVQFQLKVIKTEGDRDRRRPLSEMGGRGVFVRELETALLRKEIDVAVHSLKDLPTQTPPSLVLAAFSEREEVRDALVSPRWGRPLAELPPGASLGTSSPRRAAQLLALRPDLKMVELRGNVDTRLRKAQDLDGVIVAAVGLERLGLQGNITQYLPPEVCLPAPGQGALAVEVRADDEEMRTLTSAADHLPTRQAVLAERAFLGGLGGGCQVPVGALGTVRGDSLHLEGMVAAPDGKKVLRSQIEGDARSPEEVGKRLAEMLLGMGAGELIER